MCIYIYYIHCGDDHNPRTGKGPFFSFHRGICCFFVFRKSTGSMGINGDQWGVEKQEWLQSLEPMGFLLCYLPKMLALGHPTVLWRFLQMGS